MEIIRESIKRKMNKKIIIGMLCTISLLFSSCSKDDDLRMISDDMVYYIWLSVETPELTASRYDRDKPGVFLNYEDAEKTKFMAGIKAELVEGEIYPKELMVEWTSSIDGPLYKGTPNKELQSVFEKKLSKGLHEITCEVWFRTNPEINRRITYHLSNVIGLQTEVTDRSVKLHWTKYTEPDFKSYLLYRGNNVIEIKDQETNFYEDFEMRLIDSLNYQVLVERNTESDILYASNFQKEQVGRYLKTDHFISKVIGDPSRDYVYALVSPEKYSYASAYGLLIFDTSGNEIKEYKHLLAHYRFSDLDFSPDGNYLFLCCRDKVVQLDLSTHEVVKEITLNESAHRIEIGDNNRLYYHLTPPTSGSTPLAIMNYETGQEYSVNQPANNNFRHGDIEYNSKTQTLYHIQSNISYGYMIKYDVSTDVTVPIEPKKACSWPKDLLIMSPDEERLFYGWGEFDLDLKSIETFDGTVLSCSWDSQMIATRKAVFKLDDYSVVQKCPDMPYGDEKGLCFANQDKAIVLFTARQPLYKQYETYIAIVGID